jgi:outer membrane protein assembly factor BamB
LALIELSTDQPVAASAPPLPAYRYRVFGLVLAAVLVLALAGAVPAVAVFWQRTGLVTVPTAADFEVVGGRLFTLEVANGQRVTSAWTMQPLRRLWRVSTTAEEISGGLLQGGSSVSVAGDLVLLRAGPTTTVLDAHTGAVRWTSALPVSPLTTTIGMVQDEQFRSGTEYDESSGAPGQLFFSSAGLPHTEPPLRTDLTGVDLATGKPIWTAQFAGSIYPTRARGRADAVVVVASDQLWLRSSGSGQVLRARPLPKAPGGGSSWGDVVGNLLLLRHAKDTGNVVTAYAMDTLEPRWQRTEPDDPGNSASCLGLTCEKARHDLVVLDPATGAPRWRTDGDVDLQAGAGYALEVQTGQSRPLRAVDIASGVTQVDLSGWQTFAVGPAAGPVVLSRRVAGKGTAFGVLLPGRRVVQQLGVTSSPVTDCYSDTRYVACRAATGVEVFSYAA